MAIRSGTPAPAGQLPRNDGANTNASIAFWVDISLLAILVLSFVLVLPRTVARFTKIHEWTHGHILYHKSMTSIGSRSISSHSTLPSISQEKAIVVSIPPHIPALSVYMHRLTSFLRTPVISRIHIGGCLMLLIYFGILLFAALYKSDIWTNPNRAGYVAASQVPVIYILGTKNNVLSALLGVSYDHINYMHRFAGRLIVLAANVHAIGFIYEWTQGHRFTREIRQPKFIWGVVALVCFDILFFFSLAIFRKRAYNLFYFSHLLALVLVLVAICLHISRAIPFVAIAAGLYGADIVLRVVKTRICKAHVERLPELDAVRVYVPHLNAGWRAGQHVRIRVLSRHMGLGVLEVHPFTIASGSGMSQGLQLMCKRTGRWTMRLDEIANLGKQWLNVMVDGPYGGPGNTLSHSFSGVLLVAGGSGIAYALAAVEELLQKASEGLSSVTVVDLLWIVQQPGAIVPILPTLTTLLTQCHATITTLNIALFYTRAPTPASPTPPLDLPPSITFLPGRPHLLTRLEDCVDRTCMAPRLNGEAKRRGILMGVCGPAELGESARRAIAMLHADVRKDVGGVELHEEIYAL